MPRDHSPPSAHLQGGPHFLLPGLVIACHVSGVALGDRASAMLTYILNHQQKVRSYPRGQQRPLPPTLISPFSNDFCTKPPLPLTASLPAPQDGGWGLHIEGPATMFGTTMNYVAARLLGLPPSHPSAVAARGFIHAHGGAVGNPHWGKFWLAVLGVYEWDGACGHSGAAATCRTAVIRDLPRLHVPAGMYLTGPRASITGPSL